MQMSMFLLALPQLGLNMPIPMLHESVLFSFSNLALAQVYCQFDFLLADINPDKDDRAIFGPDRKRRIQDLTESEARLWTRFTKSQLTRIFNLCQFPHFIEIENCGQNTYNMTGEEIFIFGMTKLAHGLDNNLLCLNFFGGSSKRWTYAYPWFLRFVDGRFSHVVGIKGLRRFVPQFPYFARKIAEKLNKP